MGMHKAFVTCICLCGTFLLAESWQRSRDTNAFFKTLSQNRRIKAAAVHLPGNDEFTVGKLMFVFCSVSICNTCD